MRAARLVRFAIAVPACAALIAGCAGPSSLAPIDPSSTQAARVAHRSGGSWMAPGTADSDLLYVSDAKGVVDVFTFPAGAPVGELTGFQSPAGLCSDSSGNVFVVNTNGSDVLEYAHGGTKAVRTIFDGGEYPYGCAVDPKTENLAVANYITTKVGAGSVSIFIGAKGGGRTYQDPNFSTYYFCSYDDDGNLFVDGADANSVHTLFAELPKGKSKFTDITLDQTIGFPGAVQWDGQYVDVGDTFGHDLYRFKIAGAKGTSAGRLGFGGDRSMLVGQFWIEGSTIVSPYGTFSRGMHKVGLWAYPKGGSPSASIDVRNSAELVGATVSVAK